MEPEVHYLILNFPPPLPVLSQIDKFDAPQSTSWNSILILSSYLSLDFQVVYVSQVSPPQRCTQHSSFRYMLHDSPTSFFFMWSTEQYFVMNIDHYVVCSTPLSPRPS